MQRSFLVPTSMRESSGFVAKTIVESIPNQWRVLKGVLFAPPKIGASKTTHWAFASSINPMIKGVKATDIPDFAGSFMGITKPDHVRFGGYHGYAEYLPMIQGKQMCVWLLGLGYTGSLRFEWKDMEHSRERPLWCEILIPKNIWESVSITVASDNRERGDPGATVEPILQTCAGFLQHLLEEVEVPQTR